MPIGPLLGSLAGRFRRSSHRTPERAPPSGPGRARTGKQKGDSDFKSPGFFDHANNLVVNQPTMVENQVVNSIAMGKTVLEHLTPHTNLDAVMDSSARDPPPSCHPGTRLRIGDKLEKWVSGPGRQWNITWLHGPAGTGKSAVAQTFAEQCSERDRLGAAFFFSRPNDRSDPDCVIPTLAYQLAVNLPEYKSLLTGQLVNDPQLLRRSLRVQFKKLIIEPFSVLQLQEDRSVQEPLIIILDGLDECEGEEVQCEFVDMISEVVRLKKDLPFLWLICSRPEPHLKYIFSRADFIVNCSREELVIDDESRADVNKYMRDGFSEIKTKFWDVTDRTWPSEEQFSNICGAADGLFIFASTVMKYIGDLRYADPMAQLDAVLSFLKGAGGIVKSPLEALELLYTRILNDISDEVLPTTRRILSCFIHTQKLCGVSLPAQVLSNFLDIDQRAFYRALRKLHSVIDVPTPETASEMCLRFYHTSFEDYLLDTNRSGKFAIQECSALIDIAKTCLFWYETDLSLFHTSDDLHFNQTHQHGCLPNMKWISTDNSEIVSKKLAKFSGKYCWRACSAISHPDQGLLSRIRGFDFTHIGFGVFEWQRFANWLFEKDPSSGVIRTEPTNEVDSQLVEYMESMAIGEPAPVSAKFPLNWGTTGRNQRVRDYFFVGRGSKSSIFWRSEDSGDGRIAMLNCDSEPTEELVSEHHEWLVKKGWIRSEDTDNEGKTEQTTEE